MIIATFGKTTAWVGKRITFDENQFVLEEYGPIAAHHVLDYDRQGHLIWASHGLREWVNSIAEQPTDTPNEPLPTGSDVSAAPLAAEPVLASPTAFTRCPACRRGVLQPSEPKKGFLGLTARESWLCTVCEARFVVRNDEPRRYVLDSAGPAGASVLGRYKDKALTQDEWERIAQGGLSDEELAAADLQSFMSAVRDGSARFMPPDVESPVALKKGEELVVVCSDVVLREPRTVTSGIYGGPRVRVAKGLSFNLGGFRAAPHEELKDIDSGSLVITTRRLLFMGVKRTSTANLAQVVGVEPYKDAVAVHRSNKQRMEMYCNLNRQEFEYSLEGRSYRERLSGPIVAYLIEGLATGSDTTSTPSASRAGRERQAAKAPESGEAGAAEALRSLASLRAEGLITEEEYAAKRAAIIARL